MEKKNTPVYIIDLYIIGHNHIVINSGIVSALSAIFKDRQVVFAGEKVHTSLIEENNRHLSNIRYQSFEDRQLPDQRSRRIFLWANKKLKDLNLIYRTFGSGSDDSVNYIFMTNAGSLTLVLANIYARFFKNFRLVILLHGELEYIYMPGIARIQKVKAFLYKWLLSHMSEQTNCIVLSSFVEQKLTGDGLADPKKLFSIDHPVLRPTVGWTTLSGKITFGHIGRAVKMKNSAMFFQLANEFTSEISSGQTAFYLAGRLYDIGVGESTVISFSSMNNTVPQDAYEPFIQQFDYAVFTFEKDNYVYRISGSVMDAINFGKPIIGLRHVYLDHLFKTSGNIGFLCDGYPDLVALTKRLILKDPLLVNQYAAQQANLQALQQRYSVDQLKENLITILNEI